jgi:hypothetical protein
VLKIYNWDFPEWFDSRQYNSISEFIIAYLEQVLSIRYWFAMEEKKSIPKHVLPSNFSLCDEGLFNELFDNREKLIEFLKTEYGCCKEKLFGSVIDLKKLLQELRGDDSVVSKIKKPKPESIKSCLLFCSGVPKFELFEPVKDSDFEVIGKFKKSQMENSEEAFIDELIFCKMDNLCKRIL